MEERNRLLPRLNQRDQLSPGYLDAPAAALAPLSMSQLAIKRGFPEITLVFMSIDRYEEHSSFLEESSCQLKSRGLRVG